MGASASITVELFGTARIACGKKVLDLLLPVPASAAVVAVELARICPDLVGVALRDDLSGLLESYTLNLNAAEFVDEGELTLSDGDILLLFSSQAGG